MHWCNSEARFLGHCKVSCWSCTARYLIMLTYALYLYLAGTSYMYCTALQ